MNDDSKPQEHIKAENNKEIIKLNINFLPSTKQPDDENDIDLLARFYFIFSELGIALIKKQEAYCK